MRTIMTRRRAAIGVAVALITVAVVPHDEAEALTTPSVPLNPSVVAGPTTAKMTVDWDPSASTGGTPITFYTVEASQDAGPYVAVGNPTKTLLKVTCTAVTTCTYRIKAVNGVGSSPFTSPVSATWSVPSATKTSSVTAGPTAGDMTVKWAKPTSNGGKDLLSFLYEVQTDGIGAWAGPYAVPGSSGATRSAVLPCPSVSLTGGCRYRVLAVNSVGVGAAGVDKYGAWVVPNAPILVGADAGPTNAGVELTYKPGVSNGGFAITHFTYEVSVDGGAYSAGPSFLPTSPSYPASAVVPCAAVLNCQYRLRAVSAKGTSGYSNIRVAGFEVPSAFLNPSHEVTTTHFGNGTVDVTVNWSPPTDTGGSPVVDYEAQLCQGYCETAADWAAITPISLGAGTSWTFTCDADEVTCGFKLRAVNAIGPGNWSVQRDVKPFGGRNLTAAMTTTAGLIHLEWDGAVQWLDDDFTPADSLDLQYCVTTAGCSIDGNWAPTGLAIDPDEVAIDHNCGAGITCAYRLRAEDVTGRFGPLTNLASATASAPPTAPQNLDATSSNTTIGAVDLDWDAPLDTGGFPVLDYEFRRDINGGGFGAWTSTASTLTAYTDTGCGGSNSCTYEVRAVTVVSPGPASNQDTATGANVASAPQTLVASTGTSLGAVNVTWAAPANNGGHAVTAYNLERSTAGVGGPFTPLVTLGVVLNYTDGTCGGSVTCWYRVSATNLMGTGAFSNIDDADGADVPNAAVLTAVTSTASTSPVSTLGGVDLSWTVPTDDGGHPITGYEFRYSKNAGAFTAWVSTGTGLGTSFMHICDTQNNVAPDDNCNYEVRAINLIGNGTPSNQSAANALVDHVAPTVAITTPTNGSFTNDSTPTISGTGGTAVGDATTVTVTIKQGVTTIQTIPGVAITAGTWTTTAAALPQGNYDVTASQTDWGPNTGTSATINFDVDGTPPVLVITAPVAGNNLDGNLVMNITGTSTDTTPPATAITVKVYTAGSNCTGASTSLSTTGLAWSVNDTVARGENVTISIQAEQTDLAGNFGQSSCVPVATRNAIWVNRTTGNDANPGTKASPKATIQAGITSAAGGTGRVLVGNDTAYTGTAVALASSVATFGGFALSGSTWSRPGIAGVSGTVNPTTTVFTSTTAEGAVADADTGVTLDGLRIVSANNAAAGGSSYGLRAFNGSNVTLNNVQLQSGTGGAGANGTNASGNAGNGSNGGNGGGSCGNCGTAGGGGASGAGVAGRNGSSGGGGGGQGNNSGGAGTNGIVSGGGGGNGGAGGGANGNCNDSPGGSGGGRVTATSAGSGGGSGAAGTATLAGSGVATWSAANGGNGGAAGHGHGGGGGGGGAGDGGSFISCVGDAGAGGGGGGGGGGAGNAGTAGGGSGGSFALYVHNSTVTWTTGAATSAAMTAGGTGGNGSAGGTGGNGGNGGDCDTGQEPGAGGGGGGGSGGGGGGGGGGGSAGPSIAVYENGTGTVSLTGVTLTKGGSATGGAGGAGGGGGGGGGAGTRGNSSQAEFFNGNGCFAGQNGASGTTGATGGSGGAGSGGATFNLRSYIDGTPTS